MSHRTNLTSWMLIGAIAAIGMGMTRVVADGIGGLGGGQVYSGSDDLTQQVFAGMKSAGLNHRELLRSGSCGIEFTAILNNGPPMRAQIGYAWADRDGDRRLTDAEIQIQVRQMSNPQMRTLLDPIVANMRMQCKASAETMMAQYDIKTIRQSGAYKMIATPKTPGQGKPMIVTITPDFRMTQIDTTGPNNERIVSRFQYAKVGGKWLMTAMSQSTTSPSGTASQTRRYKHTQIGGVPVVSQIDVHQSARTSQFTGTMRQQFRYVNWRVQTRGGSPAWRPATHTSTTTNTSGGLVGMNRRRTATGSSERLAKMQFQKGLKLMEAKKYKEAIAEYSEGIRLAPNRMELYRNRGVCYGSLKQYDKGIIDMTKAIELKNDNAIAYKVRSYMYYYTRQPAKALADLKSAERLGAKIDPKFRQAVQKRIDVRNALGAATKRVAEYGRKKEVGTKVSTTMRPVKEMTVAELSAEAKAILTRLVFMKASGASKEKMAPLEQRWTELRVAKNLRAIKELSRKYRNGEFGKKKD